MYVYVHINKKYVYHNNMIVVVKLIHLDVNIHNNQENKYCFIYIIYMIFYNNKKLLLINIYVKIYYN
jgi:hypothetical protein